MGLFHLRSTRFFVLLFVLLLPAASQGDDRQFAQLTERFLDELPALSPVAATLLGDHRFDGHLDEITPAARAAQSEFLTRFQTQLREIDPPALSAQNRIDYELLAHDLQSRQFYLETFRSWQWNPLDSTALAGDALYGLMAREFAPLPERLLHAADRMEQFPRFFEQVRATLLPARVPRIHAETAVNQNRGISSIIRYMIEPQLEQLPESDRQRVTAAIDVATAAIQEHQRWLEEVLLPNATGDFRVGAELYDRKLHFDLNSPLNRQDIQQRAESEMQRVREQMYELAKTVYAEQYPYTHFPARPDSAYQQAIIRAALERAYQQQPPKDGIVEAAREALEQCEQFARQRDLISIPEDPVEIIVMPEFRRGVSLAYCDSPGPLDAGQKTFYAVAPMPADWTEQQQQSFLREYNTRSLHNLTVHEAIPGHYLQLAFSNRHPSLLRKVLSSGVFIEGWAVYTEQMMAEEGFLGEDPLMRLIVLKWYLRGIANAMIDQQIHASQMTRDEAMELMIEQTFQEEREAAAKWVRAQLTSAQLSTYFVGVQEHWDLRRAVQQQRGETFQLKSYHDQVISHGSPPVRYVRQLILDE